jgi:hypothetical protein
MPRRTAIRVGRMQSLAAPLQVAPPPRGGLERECAWCRRVAQGVFWLPLRAPRRPVTHTICPDCVEELRRLGLSH